MSELEEKLNSLLSNPQLMQQIAAMAQTMGGNQQNQAEEPKEAPQNIASGMDPALLQKMMQSVGQQGVDGNQKALLHALGPYLSSGRVQKLERAMRAARLASTASSFLNSGGLQLLTGR